MTRGLLLATAVTVIVLCSGCGGGGDPSIEVPPDPPAGAVGSAYNLGNGITCAPSGSSCAPCFVGGSIRACPANWQFQDSFLFTATNGIAPFFWRASGVPPGLTIARNGTITGTPTTAGTYTVSVTVTDSSVPARNDTRTVTIVIDPPLPPTIATSPLPATAAVNRPYSNVFTAIDGVSPLVWSESGDLPPGLAFATDGTLSGTPTQVGAFPISVSVEDANAQSATPQDTTIDVAQSGFTNTAAMTTLRTLHTATLLANANVLVVGGFDGSSGLSTAELYLPDTATFVVTGAMPEPRYDHTATRLQGGSVLVVGGASAPDADPLATGLLFTPASNQFFVADDLAVARRAHTATLLNDGTVLITGGTGTNGALASAEIYNPGTDLFSTVGTMVTARTGHTATLLPSGDVLIAGGTNAAGVTLQTAEIYNVRTRRFTATGNMITARAHQAAVLLGTGEVLLAGGIAANAIDSAETYNESTGAFTQTGDMRTAHSAPTANLLSNGTVLIAGGGDAKSHLISDAELYDPASGDFTATGSMTIPRDGHTATVLATTGVLVTGGSNGSVLSSAELYR